MPASGSQDRDVMVARATAQATAQAVLDAVAAALAGRDQRVADAVVKALRDGGWLRDEPEQNDAG